MEWANILQRIESGANQTTEFKRDFKLSVIGKAICAFANCEGGMIILGIDDGGLIIGLSTDPHEVHERLTGFLQTGCSAPVGARYERHEAEEGRWVHWIQMPCIRGPEPLRHRGRFYIRHERSSVEPSPSERMDLRLLVDRQNHRPVWRSDVQSRDVAGLLRKVRIGRDLEMIRCGAILWRARMHGSGPSNAV